MHVGVQGLQTFWRAKLSRGHTHSALCCLRSRCLSHVLFDAIQHCCTPLRHKHTAESTSAAAGKCQANPTLKDEWNRAKSEDLPCACRAAGGASWIAAPTSISHHAGCLWAGFRKLSSSSGCMDLKPSSPVRFNPYRLRLHMPLLVAWGVGGSKSSQLTRIHCVHMIVNVQQLCPRPAVCLCLLLGLLAASQARDLEDVPHTGTQTEAQGQISAFAWLLLLPGCSCGSDRRQL